MNNPDERTAVDQFGSGDKYVGVATLLATLPGLPMFGHGQVEGFWREVRHGVPARDAGRDARCVAHRPPRTEIFPLLRQRWRFAAADDFRMLDALREDGSVDEDVYAYTNEVRGARSLVVYRNRYGDGRVRITGAGASLGIPDDAAAWLVLRDLRTGLEHLRNCREIHVRGLELDLRAYQSHVFLDPAVVWDDPAGDLGRLAWRVGLAGVADVQAALRDQLLEPARMAVDSLFQTSVVRDVAGAGLAPTDASATRLVDSAVASLSQPLEAIARAIGATSGRGVSVDTVRSAVAGRLEDLVSGVRAGRAATRPTPGTADSAHLASWVGSDRGRWATLVSWALGTCLGDLVGASTPGAVVGVFDAWAAGPAISRVVTELGMPPEDASRVAVAVRGLLAVPVGASAVGDQVATLAAWLQAPAVRAAVGWNEWQSAEFVVQEAFEDWLAALAARDTAAAASGSFDRVASLTALVAANDFRVDALETPRVPEGPDANVPAGD